MLYNYLLILTKHFFFLLFFFLLFFHFPSFGTLDRRLAESISRADIGNNPQSILKKLKELPDTQSMFSMQETQQMTTLDLRILGQGDDTHEAFFARSQEVVSHELMTGLVGYSTFIPDSEDPNLFHHNICFLSAFEIYQLYRETNPDALSYDQWVME